MNTAENALSFGRYLKAQRLNKGINLEEVSKETKIGMDILLAIEKEDHDQLPAEVFVKGFLRAYAKAICANGDDIVQRYLVDHSTYQETAKVEAELARTSAKFWPRLILSLTVLACIVAGSVFLLSDFPDQELIVDQALSKPEMKESNIVSSETLKKSDSKKLIENNPKKLLLKIVAVKDTWMKVIIDSQHSEKYSLNPGDHLELEAASDFNLLIGDAKGVTLTLNNQKLNIPGKSGQVVTVQLP